MAKTAAGKEDKAIGVRIRAARLASGMTQEGLAEVLGISFQQVQKYEKGLNRISASQLLLLARYFGLPAARFLDENGTSGDAQHLRLLLDYRRISIPLLQQVALKHITLLADMSEHTAQDKFTAP